jgi:hypothetical protein
MIESLLFRNQSELLCRTIFSPVVVLFLMIMVESIDELPVFGLDIKDGEFALPLLSFTLLLA